jgi:hypothetical protein
VSFVGSNTHRQVPAQESQKAALSRLGAALVRGVLDGESISSQPRRGLYAKFSERTATLLDAICSDYVIWFVSLR